jgi:hypothetical protein
MRDNLPRRQARREQIGSSYPRKHRQCCIVKPSQEKNRFRTVAKPLKCGLDSSTWTAINIVTKDQVHVSAILEKANVLTI